MARKDPIDPAEPDRPCPLTTAINALGGKWSLICLYWLMNKPRHFGALEELMPGISRKVLTETLRDLEAHGLVIRSPRGDAMEHVDYALSAYGSSVRPLIEAMRDCGISTCT